MKTIRLEVPVLVCLTGAITNIVLIILYHCYFSVIRASMDSVLHKDRDKHSEISVSVSRIVRQKSPDLFYRISRNSPNLRGKLHTPRKCEVSRGVGDYLFTGRLRLGQLHVTCATYIKEWENILHKALEDGTMECSLD